MRKMFFDSGGHTNAAKGTALTGHHISFTSIGAFGHAATGHMHDFGPQTGDAGSSGIKA